jgi:hypothetical protein
VLDALDTVEAQAVVGGEGGGGGAFAVGGHEVGDVAFVEALGQALRVPNARLWDGSGPGECHYRAKSQVSGLRRVRVSGEYLHRRTPRLLSWAFVLLRCASPYLCRYGEESRSVSRSRRRSGRRPLLSMSAMRYDRVLRRSW